MAIFSNLNDCIDITATGIVTEESSLLAGDEFEIAVNEATSEYFDVVLECSNDIIMLTEALLMADITIDRAAIRYISEAAAEGEDKEEAKEKVEKESKEKSEEVKKSFVGRVKGVIRRVIEAIKKLCAKVVAALKKFFSHNVLVKHPELIQGKWKIKGNPKIKGKLPDIVNNFSDDLGERVMAIINDSESHDEIERELNEIKKNFHIDTKEEVFIDDAYVKNCVTIMREGKDMIKAFELVRNAIIKRLEELVLNNDAPEEDATRVANSAKSFYGWFSSNMTKAIKLANTVLWRIVKNDNVTLEKTDKKQKSNDNKKTEGTSESYSQLFESFLNGEY